MSDDTEVAYLSSRSRWWMAVACTVAIAGLLTAWGVYVIGSYGIALFVLTPLFVGLAPTMIYGVRLPVTLVQAFNMGMASLGILVLGLLIFAIEGMICVVMFLPIAVPLILIGASFGRLLTRNSQSVTLSAMIVLACMIPAMAFMERDTVSEVETVVTSIIVDAPPEVVWHNVVSFSTIEPPTEFLFKTGIAYPIDARIDGRGVGAIRHCNFTTGSFVEPITTWDEPKLLAFNVVHQPVPMKELSFWDIDAPHLHHYFASQRGQFRLTPLADGETLLEGTTWYTNRISPSLYWKFWSDYIIHSIHTRVLLHIKKCAEGHGR